MTPELSLFAARLRGAEPALPHIGSPAAAWSDGVFNTLALELFALQFAGNQPYRKLCEARSATPANVRDRTQIPAVPTAAFKEFELTSLAPAERTTVFHSSGTTGQKPSRHFHCAESLALYEASMWAWFRDNFRFTNEDLRAPVFMTPPPEQAPNSSLVHMFETVRVRATMTGGKTFNIQHSTSNAQLKTARGVLAHGHHARLTGPHPGLLPSDGRGGMLGRAMSARSAGFVGRVDSSGAWTLDFDAALAALASRAARPAPQALLLFGTAFSFVHLLDHLAERDLRLQLPPGTRVMETGGYKGRSRVMPKAELHGLITERLGVPASHIVCEYGMSELSSQAYDNVTSDVWQVTQNDNGEARHPSPVTRHFVFPPWARVQIISPETGREVAEGETGLIRVFDLANAFSVMAIQTEDLAVRRGDGFELLGRAQVAEPRGCSLMTA